MYHVSLCAGLVRDIIPSEILNSQEAFANAAANWLDASFLPFISLENCIRTFILTGMTRMHCKHLNMATNLRFIHFWPESLLLFYRLSNLETGLANCKRTVPLYHDS